MKPVLLLAALTAVAAAQAPPGSIEGVVFDSATRAPVRKAVVTTWSTTPPQDRFASMRPPRPVTARTEAGGNFTLRDLPPGIYQLAVQHPRYPQMPGQAPVSVEVKAGETARVAIPLTPGALISGRVLDEDGDPLSGCWPQLLAARQGDPVGLAGTEHSDSTGAYSLWGIAPGRYRLRIACNSPILESHPLRPVTDPPPPPTLAYPPAYYPGVTNSGEAQLIEVAAGQERTGVDFQMKPARVFTVAGIVRPGDFDRSKLNLMLVPRNQPWRETGSVQGAGIDPAKGTFTFQNVFPGSYTLIGVVRDDSGPRHGLRQEIEVPGTGPLELEPRPGSDVTGKVEVEGEFKSPLNSISLQLLETEPVGMGASPSRVAEDGSFTIPGLLPGLYRVQAFGPGLFVKSVSWAGTELQDGVINASAGGSGPLTVLLSSKTATIKATGPPNRPVEAIAVSQPYSASYGGQTDPQGNISLMGLPPGSYRVKLRGGTGGDSTGEEVTVAEGETVTLTLRDPSNR